MSKVCQEMRNKIIEDIYTQKKSDNENESAVAS